MLNCKFSTPSNCQPENEGCLQTYDVERLNIWEGELYHLRKLNSQILALAHNLALTRMTGARVRLRVQTISKISIEYDFLGWAII